MKSYRASSGNPSSGQLWNTPSGRTEHSGIDQSNLSQKLLYNKYNNNNNIISSGGGGASGGSGHINSSQMDCDYSKLFYAKRK